MENTEPDSGEREDARTIPQDKSNGKANLIEALLFANKPDYGEGEGARTIPQDKSKGKAKLIEVPVNDSDDDSHEDLFFPECDDSLKPRVGLVFPTLEVAEEFYDNYARDCGFETRKGAIRRTKDGTIRKRWMYCNREGGYYKIVTFNEGHTHTMIPEISRQFMMTNRKVGDVQQMIIQSAVKANIGPMKSFRFYKELVGKYDDVGCTSRDFRNYTRDLKGYTKGSDADMLIQEFKKKQQYCDSFKFYYELHEGMNRIRCLFWADDVSIRNYNLFGEAVSFDATYNTNRYKMIFAPFTGKDNHGRCVSFGAALMFREDENAYAWVLERFKECMGSAPTMLITDQDPALRKAVASVWPDTKHRFCMWHITMKVKEKLPNSLMDNSDLRAKLDNIIWTDNDEPTVFEEKWRDFIEEYNLSENRWFNDMYEDRALWIPAYFRDIRMSGLFRTTSLSESENSFFRQYLNKNSDLLMLYMNFNSAMDYQRHTYHKVTYDDETCAPVLKTNVALETHASTLYTSAVFKEVQDEIEASKDTCMMFGVSYNGEDCIYSVDDLHDGKFKVVYEAGEDYLSCSCKLFISYAVTSSWYYATVKPQKYQRNTFFLAETLGYVNGNEELTNRLFLKLTEVRDEFKELCRPDQGSSSQLNNFEQFYGSSIPEVPSVLPPLASKTKGSGAGGRRKSHAEKAMLLAQKPLRLCRKCNRKCHHDSRNCPGKDGDVDV
ncbi:protein FAR1-RELATED SEQUENCE 5-like [Salvia miltiorrhiza]|uniref:protein FAR1-RELATED SEQUENCE 5-like n=1 Tax=Salvia miltiorrhiza TaxID=226208 RepID=UPI0025AD0BBB|nr:protein FAR1-RELATED SEQUENCE 5-like [Salvia miltiorrhiza]